MTLKEELIELLTAYGIPNAAYTTELQVDADCLVARVYRELETKPSSGTAWPLKDGRWGMLRDYRLLLTAPRDWGRPYVRDVSDASEPIRLHGVSYFNEIGEDL